MKNKGIRISKVLVSDNDVRHLFRCIEAGINSRDFRGETNIRLLDYERKAIVISFDAKWQPFIGFTFAYNPPDQRIYLPYGIQILETIAERLQERGADMPGGRVFISKYTAFIKDSDGRQITLCLFDWKGDNPLNTATEILRNRIVG